jgi:SnoaL-like domain
MNEMKMNGTRRAFFLRGGALLGAGVAATAAAGALLPGTGPTLPQRLQELQRELTNQQDRESIRRLHLAFTGAIENQAYETAVELFEPRADLNLSGLSAAGKPAIVRLFATQYRPRHARVLHSAYRQSPRQQQDLVAIAADGAHATATFHCEVELTSPLPADSTLAQMARLQGQVAERHWEAGRFEARYVKTGGQWKIAALRYLTA